MKNNHYEHIDEVKIGDIVQHNNIICCVTQKASEYHVIVEQLFILDESDITYRRHNIFQLTKLSLLDLCNIRLKLDNIINELARHNSGE